MYLLSPLFKWDSVYAHEGERIMSAVIVTVPMFAYVVMGLWGCGQYMIWLGLGITALTVLGLYAFPSFFYLWMAAVGGGALFGVGIIARRQWKKA